MLVEAPPPKNDAAIEEDEECLLEGAYVQVPFTDDFGDEILDSSPEPPNYGDPAPETPPHDEEESDEDGGQSSPMEIVGEVSAPPSMNEDVEQIEVPTSSSFL